MDDIDNIDIEYIIESINENKWWRFFNLKGLRLKLTEPISPEYFPCYDDDRYFISIVSYLSETHRKKITWNSDWVTFKCNKTTVNPTYSINLSRLDFDYFNNLTNV